VNLLVVGGCGYVGGAVIDLLLGSRYNLRVYDSLLYEECYRKPVEFVFGDLRDRARLKPHLDWADAVVWLAALVGDGACALDPEISDTINRESVAWLADHYDGRILFMSTCSVYGAQDGVLDEFSATRPLSVYASTKLGAEQYLLGKDALIFRLGTLFGVGDLFSRIRLDLVVNTMTVKAYLHSKIIVFGGDQYRPLLHVRDVGQAIIDNLASDHTGVFNLHWQNMRIRDIAYQIRDHFPGLEIDEVPTSIDDARNYRVSSDKARRVLGFQALHGIDEGVEELKELLFSCRLRDIENPRYANHAYLSQFPTHKRLTLGYGKLEQRELVHG
jgi:nucleoside-diphosphate-sugar epimerase